MVRSRLVCIVVVAALSTLGLPGLPGLLASMVPRAAAEAHQRAELYQPPVDAPVIDPFRPPDQPWLAGNRGLEYDTAPGTVVRAIGSGLVVFAGPVAGRLYVTVLHGDGIRSSYSYLASIAVGRGDRVRGGQAVGVTSDVKFHLGARVGSTYIDPASLFGSRVGAASVFLVPIGPGGEPGRPGGDAGPGGVRPAGRFTAGGTTGGVLTGTGRQLSQVAASAAG